MSGQSSLSRREALKRGAILTGAAAWAVPTVQVVGMSRAFAQAVSEDGPDAAHWALNVKDITCGDDGIETAIIEFTVDRNVTITGLGLAGRTVRAQTQALNQEARPLRAFTRPLTRPTLTGREGQLIVTISYIGEATDTELQVELELELECRRS